MNNWVLLGAKNLEKRSQPALKIDKMQVKVRVTHVLLAHYDALCYTGDKKIPYPRTIGRYAIGVVTEAGEGCYGVKKGSRVYLEALRPCHACVNCKSGKSSDCSSPLIVAQDFDGFLRDFVVCDYRDVTTIPDQVDTMRALCIEHVALAENIFARLNLAKGTHVAIIGAGFLGSVLAQIAIYHRIVPVMIDNYTQNIERMKRSGMFFSFAADENLYDNVLQATSGCLCDAAIYTSDCKLPSTVPARVLARNKDLVLGGFNTTNFSLESAPLFEKNLRIYSVSDGFGYTETAINMLLHGALDLSNFEKETLKTFDVDAILTEKAANASRSAKMTVLKFIL